jgi:osmotically-inducible protein OsmY
VVPSAKKEAVQARDDELKDQIADRIKARDDLRGTNIDVEVKNGVVRLTGKVDNEEQRLTAAIVARGTPGVRAVRDELNVASERRPG